MVSPEWRTTCTPPPLLSTSLSLIRLHPSLVLHQCWIILLFYYSPEAAGADAALRSFLVPSAFFFFFIPPASPSPHFPQPRRKGNEGGRSRRRGREAIIPEGAMEKGKPTKTCVMERRMGHIKLPTRKRLDGRDRWIKGLTEDTSTRDFRPKLWHTFAI